MATTTKRNVSEFNSDVAENGGYRYTENAPYSSIVSNKRISDKVVEILSRMPGMKTVVDIGCGDGTYTGELKTRLPGLEFTGFDPADQAITLARGKAPACEFLVGNILDPTTFPDRKFDVGVIRGVIHHLPTQAEAIANSARLADRIVIVEPNGNNPIVKYIEKHSQYHLDHEEQSFTSAFLCKACEDHGFRVTSVSFIGFVPFFFPTLPAKIIHLFQPLLELVPLLARFLGGQVVIVAEKAK